MERKWNGNGTELERERNGTGNVTRMKEVQ